MSEMQKRGLVRSAASSEARVDAKRAEEPEAAGGGERKGRATMPRDERSAPVIILRVILAVVL